MIFTFTLFQLLFQTVARYFISFHLIIKVFIILKRLNKLSLSLSLSSKKLLISRFCFLPIVTLSEEKMLKFFFCVKITKSSFIKGFQGLNGLFSPLIFKIVKLKTVPAITHCASYSSGLCPLTLVIAFPQSQSACNSDKTSHS